MRYVVVGVLLCLLMGVVTQAQDDYTPSIDYFRCRNGLPSGDISGETAFCGEVTVPMNRDNPDGATVTIPFVRFNAYSDTPHPDPVVYIIGGPGGGTTPFPSFMMRPNFELFRQDRDFILFDGRGNGTSTPSLDCEPLLQWNYQSATQDLTDDERYQQRNDILLDCHQDFVDAGIDLTQYNSRVNAHDLNDLRIALGYEQWNVFGVSYGSQVALNAMRYHPEGIRSVILDSTVPLQANLWEDIARHYSDSFETLFTACVDDSACNGAYPDLASDFYDLIEALEVSPVDVSGRHSFQGFRFEARVDGDMFADVIFSGLYNPPTQLPRLINEVANGNLSNLPSHVEGQLDGAFGISEGVYYSVHCNEVVPFSDRDAVMESVNMLPTALQSSWEASFNALFDLCELWDSGVADPIEAQAVESDIPTLIVNGAFDPITPPAWAEMVHNDLSNSYFFVYPTAGHGSVNDEVCTAQMALAFVDDPSVAPDDSCIADLVPRFNTN